MTGTFDSALQYMNKGFSVIPVRKDKKPCIRWEDHQKQKADEGKIREWWKRYPEAEVAIVTGEMDVLICPSASQYTTLSFRCFDIEPQPSGLAD